MWSPTLSVMKPTVLATSAPRVWIASPISGLSTTSAREPPCPIANKSDGMLVDADRQLAAPGWRRRALPDRAVPATSRGRGRLSGARARFSNGAGGGGRGFDSPLSPFLFFCLVWVVWWCCGVGWVGLCGCCVGCVGLGFVDVVCLVVFVFCLWVWWSGLFRPACVCVFCVCFPFACCGVSSE